jgi:diacylglycerol O-acyltransferase / wax synthase
MKQLSALDATFLHVEDRRVLGHVASLIVLDPSTRGGPVNADVIREYIAARIHLLPPLTWRLVTVPLGLDLPYWVVDPDLDLDFHVRGIALPHPGTQQQLAEQVARLVARPLDRTYPLWELYVIEGLADGRVGVMTKLHHSAVDGKAGVRILSTLLSPEPDQPAPPPPPRPVSAGRVPTEAEMLLRGWMGLLMKPEQALRLGLQLSRELAASAQRLGLDGLRELGRPQPTVPRLPFNHTLSSRRSWAFGSFGLDEVRAVKNTHDVTVNDVVMALCTGALRRWLLDHDALPDVPVLAMVPISVRTAEESDTPGNQVSEVVVPLPTHLHDPVERLLHIHDSMRAARAQHDALPAVLLQEFGQFTAPAAAEFAARAAASLRWADRVALPFNLVISNVPGPREPLYYAGALMEAIYPVSMIADGVGLNITVHSYRDHLDVGLISTPELIPDLWSFPAHLHAALAELS